MNKQSRIYVAGSTGMVGSAIVRELHGKGFTEVITERIELRDPDKVRYFMASYQPEYVFMAAAKVGGIHANQSMPAEFIYDNLMMQTNLIEASHRAKVQKLLFLGSSCIYPRYAEQPIQEKALLTGPLEPTNEAYAIAKIAGLKMVEAYRKQYGCNFISAMPCNLYGTGDTYHTEYSHVVPALIMKIYSAYIHKQHSVTLWGSGMPRRELMHVEDCASACVYLMQFYSGNTALNIGTGRDVTIKQLAQMISNIIGYEGDIRWDRTMPDGTPRKVLNVSSLVHIGWEASIELQEGLKRTVREYISLISNTH